MAFWRWLWAAAAAVALTAGAARAEDEGPSVTRFVVCADVVDRACVGEARRFGLDAGTLWAYAELDNRGPPLPVRMVWRRDGAEVNAADLEVGRSRRWRTWSRKRIRAGDAGGWVVELWAADRPLGAVAFAIGDGPIPEARVAGVVESAPVEHPPIEAAPVQAAPVEPAPAAPPVETAPIEHPPVEPAPVEHPPVEPAPVEHSPVEAAPVEAAPVDPAPAAPPVRPATAAAPVEPAPIEPTPPPPGDTACRAWVDVATAGPDGPDYQTLDLRIGPRVRAFAAPGLVVRGPDGALHALAIVRRAVEEKGPGGLADRRWDMLLGRPVDGGRTTVWAGFPATLAPPEAGDPPRFEQTNRLEILSVVGPHVGLAAHLRRARGEADVRVWRHALTATAPGADPLTAALDAASPLRAAFAALPAERRPDPAEIDPARFALVPGPAVRAFAPCCGRPDGEPVAVDAPIEPPPALAAELPVDGRYVGPDDCVVEWKGGRLSAGRGAARAPVESPVAIERVLGVVFVPVNHPHRAEAQARAARTLR